MNIDVRLIIFLAISLSMIQGAYCIAIGGGSSASVGIESIARGSFVADSTGASSTVKASGIIPYAGDLRYVEDIDGKRAEMLFNVTGVAGSFKYSATFSPKENDLDKTVASVSASQSLTVTKADSITLHAAAQSTPGSDVVNANLTVERVDPLNPASFSGSTLSSATATSTQAKIQGKVIGAISGSANYGGSIGGPYIEDLERDSNGGKVECNLLMKATSTDGTGTLVGASTFTVNAALSETIQAAANASLDGDVINVARGTYRENVSVDRSVTIKGSGPGKTIVDGQWKDSVFTIGMEDSGVEVTLSDMTITHGNATDGGGINNQATLTLKNCQITENNAEYGGGIYNFGMLTPMSCKISENTATYGGGLFNFGGLISSKNKFFANSARYGGGVYNNFEASHNGDTISGNDALYGGGICNFGTAAVTKSLISGNYASNWGGGIVTLGNSYLEVTGSTISGNSAFFGAGLDCDYGSYALVTGSTISGNTANSGGGVYSNSTTDLVNSKITGNYATYGSAIVNHRELGMDKTTVSGNKAYYGTIYNNGTMTAEYSTISKNKAEWGGAFFNRNSLTVTGSTLSGNTATGGAGISNIGTADVIDSKITGNKALYGGGIFNEGTLYVGGTTQITGNQATSAYGGGICSTTDDVTLDGTKVYIKSNKAHQPSSPGAWYQGYGVFLYTGSPTTVDFNNLTQVTGNTKV